jgi:hypothetical protein
MVARGRNSTSHNHCAIDQSIGVRWHGADQFLASRNIHGTFKQTWFALFVKTTLSLRYGGVDVTRRIRVAAGEAFRPMMNMMAKWGLKWGQGLIGPDDLDSQLLIWGIRQHIDREDITAQEFVLRFDFRGIPKGSRTPRHWWMLIRRDEIEVCLKDPGQNLDVMIEADHEAEYTGGLVHWDCHFGSRKVLTARGEWQTPVLFGVLSFPARLPPAMVPVGERREHRPRFVSGLSKARFAAFRHERQRHRHDGGRDHRRLGPARHPA